jgi:hypothetical protein
MALPAAKTGLTFIWGLLAILKAETDLVEDNTVDGFTITKVVSNTIGALTNCTKPSGQTIRKEST